MSKRETTKQFTEGTKITYGTKTKKTVTVLAYLGAGEALSRSLPTLKLGDVEERNLRKDVDTLSTGAARYLVREDAVTTPRKRRARYYTPPAGTVNGTAQLMTA